MTKPELRKHYESRNAALVGKDGEITLSRKNFWRFFESTYDAAHEQGVRNGRAAEKIDRSRFPKADIFSEFFNKKP